MTVREDALSLELYIVLACITGIMGLVLLPLAIFPDVDLGMRVLRVAIALLLLYACHYTGRVALRGLRERRTASPWRSDPSRLDDEVLKLLRDGRRLGAIRLYRDVKGVGLLEARREIKRIVRERKSGTQRE